MSSSSMKFVAHAIALENATVWGSFKCPWFALLLLWEIYLVSCGNNNV